MVLEINSLSRKRGWGVENEDMQSILTIKLIKVVMSMPSLSTEGQIVNYIANSIKNHFLNTIKRINNIGNKEVYNLEKVEQSSYTDNHTVIFESMLTALTEKKQQIIRLKYQYELSDKEIAVRLNISRQAVNKNLRSALKFISENKGEGILGNRAN